MWVTSVALSLPEKRVPQCQDASPTAAGERRCSHAGGMSNTWQGTLSPGFGPDNVIQLCTQHEEVLQARLDTW